MSDTTFSSAPTDGESEISQPSAPADAPSDPPPLSAGSQAGTDEPPASDPPDASPGALVPPVITEESAPAPADLDVAALPLIDSPEAARAALGDSSGVPAEPILPAAGEPSGPEHPHDTLQRLRAKLAAYGEECLRAVQPEVEYLLQLCDPAHDE